MVEDRKNMVRIPDLLNDNKEEDKQIDQNFKVSEMFATANNGEFEQVYRATTSHVKKVFLRRLQSKNEISGGLDGQRGILHTSEAPYRSQKGHASRDNLHHRRANSISTAAATTYGLYRSGRNNQAKRSEAATRTLNNSDMDTSRLPSAMTEFAGQNNRNRAIGTRNTAFSNNQRGSSAYMASSD